MSKFMIEDAQITKASSFQPIVSGNTPEVVNIASTLGKVAQYHDEIEKTNNVLPDLVDNKPKNLLNTARLSNLAPGYITCYRNDDGSLLITHVTSSNTDMLTTTVYLEPGEYVLSGCTDVGDSNLQLLLYAIPDPGTAIAAIDGSTSHSNVDFTITTAAEYQFRIRCGKSGNFSNVLIKPMICTKAAWDISHRFVSPYADERLGGVNNRGKNFYFFDDMLGDGMNTGCSYTELSPGVYQCSCSSTGGSAKFIQFNFRIEYPGRFILSGCPSGGSNAGYRLDVRNSSSNTLATDYGSGSNVFHLNAGSYAMTIRFDGSQESYSDIVFKPMLCTPEDWALSHDFVPGAPSARSVHGLYDKFKKFNNDTTTYTFSGLRDLTNSNKYHYGIIVGGGGSNVSGSMWLVFVGAGTEGVIITKIGGGDSKTLTGTVDRSTSTLTITSTQTIYGGLRLIWLE